jgi:hypothetical protein
MAITIDDKPKSTIPALPKGTYNAVISGVWDIGLQKTEWKGVEKLKHQVIVRFETSKTIDAPDTDYHGKRYAPAAWINLPEGFDERSNFIKLRDAAENRATAQADYVNFDEQTLLGRNVSLSTKLNGKGNATVDTYSAAMEGMPVIVPELDAEMPDWVKEMAAKAVNSVSTEDPTVSAPAQREVPANDFPPADAYVNDQPEVLPFD